MRQIVQKTFGQPITIELLERLNLPSSKPTTTTVPTITTTPSRVVVNPSLLTQQSTSPVQQQLLYTTVQPQQKINLLQQTNQSALIGSTASLLGQQQQLQQQARAQIVCLNYLLHLFKKKKVEPFLFSCRVFQEFVRLLQQFLLQQIQIFLLDNNSNKFNQLHKQLFNHQIHFYNEHSYHHQQQYNNHK